MTQSIADVLDSVDEFFWAREALEAVSTANNKAFDAAMARHEEALAALRKIVALAREQSS